MDELYNELWLMELYGIIIGTILKTLQAIVHVYLLLFGFALVAYIMVKALELLEAKQK
jgi:hypothetical protein